METHVISLPSIINELQWVTVMLLIDYAAVVAAILIDLRSGVLKAKREGKPRTSKGYRQSVDKTSRYLITLLALSVIDSVVIMASMLFRATMGWDILIFPLFTTLGAIALTLIEGKSVMENVQSRKDFTSAATKATELLNAKELHQLIDAIKTLTTSNEKEKH